MEKDGMEKKIAAWVLILVTLIVCIVLWGIWSGKFKSGIGQEWRKVDLGACLYSGGGKDVDPLSGEQVYYCDPNNKVYPVDCAICIGAKTTLDDDKDGMFDECEKDGGKDKKTQECTAYKSSSQCCTGVDPCPGLTSRKITCVTDLKKT